LLNKLKGTKFECEIEDEGATLLMLAAQRGLKDLVEVMTRNGYKVTKIDKAGKSALFYCIDSAADDADVLEFIIKEGGDLGKVN